MFDPKKDLKAGSIIVFRPVDWVGKAICWEEWGMGVKSPEFCHVAVSVLIDGQIKIFQENPPAASFREIDSIDWNNVAVFQLNTDLNNEELALAEKWCKSKIGMVYGYPSIFGFLGLGLFGRIMPGMAKSERSNPNPIASKSMQVCSQVVDNLFLEQLKMDILPAIAYGEALPGDLTQSVFHTWIFGKLGA
jgi:hypothetical protein